MKLIDLHPILTGTLDAGTISFDCPCGGDHGAGVRVARTQGVGVWSAVGDSLETLTLEPSIAVSRGHGAQCWHGWCRNGEMVTA